MGSLARVSVFYRNLNDTLKDLPPGTPVYGMMLDGNNLYREELQDTACIVIGNEAKGISEGLTRYVTHKISIPHYPETRKEHAESLNAAIATGIVCAEFRRRF
jgi:TrmH family RNA methyltransferase